MAQLKLTKSAIDRLSHPRQGQCHYWDTQLKGFGLVVGRITKTFVVQRDIYGQTRRMKIGRYGTITTDQARKEAMQRIAQMDRGEDPVALARERKARGTTFEEAAALYREGLVRREASRYTLRDFDIACRYLSGWNSRTLAEISRSEVQKRHSELAKRGPYAANRAMRIFRAIYNSAMRLHEELPANPAIAVQWFKEHRRQEPVPEKELPKWHKKVQSIQNPVRRDYQLFLLFTGLRRNDAASVRWEDVDFEAGTLHRPKPKGGKEKAFTLPLSNFLIELLRRRKKGNAPYGEDCPWVFPTHLRDGTLSHIRNPREGDLPLPHRLRDTYTTAANNAGLSLPDIDVLTNHRPANGSVTAGYINQGFEHLREQQEKVTEYLLGKINV